jgi:hypothetical protein
MVFPHSGSVNYTNFQMYGLQLGRAPRFLVFHSCAETTKAWPRDSTFVCKYALFLFWSGSLRIAVGKSHGELGPSANNGYAREERRLDDERGDDDSTCFGGAPIAAAVGPEDLAATLGLAVVRQLLSLDKRDSNDL